MRIKLWMNPHFAANNVTVEMLYSKLEEIGVLKIMKLAIATKNYENNLKKLGIKNYDGGSSNYTQ